MSTRLNRRDFMRCAVGGAAAGALPLSSAVPASSHANDRPNIVLMMADDVSARAFGCYGHRKHRTPHLDRMARRGVMYRTCWATPICGPTRAEIMTGRYGFRTGWYHNRLKVPKGKAGTNFQPDNLIFAELLKRAGYATAVCGKWQLPGAQADYGFDENCMWIGMQGKDTWFDGPVEGEGCPLPGRAARYWHPAIKRNGEPVETGPDDYGPDLFVDFLLDFAGRHRSGPFLVYYPMVLPHISWDFENKRHSYLPVPELDESGRRTGDKRPGSLRSNVEYIDSLVGRIERGLEELGLRENTVILFTADNGTAGYGKGNVRLEHGPRVPLVVGGAQVKAQGAVDALVDFSDVLPTLCELGGATPPADYEVDGHSFAPVLRGESDGERDWIFSFYADHRMLRDHRWLRDGTGTFWDCGDRRNERGYKNVTDSDDPEVVSARKRFGRILATLPPPRPEEVRKHWHKPVRQEVLDYWKHR